MKALISFQASLLFFILSALSYADFWNPSVISRRGNDDPFRNIRLVYQPQTNPGDVVLSDGERLPKEGFGSFVAEGKVDGPVTEEQT